MPYDGIVMLRTDLSPLQTSVSTFVNRLVFRSPQTARTPSKRAFALVSRVCAHKIRVSLLTNWHCPSLRNRAVALVFQGPPPINCPLGFDCVFGIRHVSALRFCYKEGLRLPHHFDATRPFALSFQPFRHDANIENLYDLD